MNGIMVNFGNLKSKILMTHKINTKHLNFNTVSAIIHEDKKLVLSKETIANISNCRSYLDTKLKDSKEPIYGINTGFGSLCNVKISDKNLSELITETKEFDYAICRARNKSKAQMWVALSIINSKLNKLLLEEKKTKPKFEKKEVENILNTLEKL